MSFISTAIPKPLECLGLYLEEAGIHVPQDGILDPWSWADRTQLKAKILRLKDKLGLPLEAIERLEQKKFETLGPANAQKVKISNGPFIFGQGDSVYANLHIHAV